MYQSKTKEDEIKRELVKFGLEFVKLFLPENFERRFKYSVYASKLTKSKCRIPLHNDQKNVAPQYYMMCENFSGAWIECFSEDETSSYKFDLPYTALKMDARLSHQIAISNFTGVRFAFVVYVVDHDKIEDLCYPPFFLK